MTNIVESITHNVGATSSFTDNLSPFIDKYFCLILGKLHPKMKFILTLARYGTKKQASTASLKTQLNKRNLYFTMVLKMSA